MAELGDPTFYAQLSASYRIGNLALTDSRKSSLPKACCVHIAVAVSSAKPLFRNKIPPQKPARVFFVRTVVGRLEQTSMRQRGVNLGFGCVGQRQQGQADFVAAQTQL